MKKLLKGVAAVALIYVMAIAATLVMTERVEKLNEAYEKNNTDIVIKK